MPRSLPSFDPSLLSSSPTATTNKKQKQQRVPIPVSVTLYNLYVPVATTPATTGPSSNVAASPPSTTTTTQSVFRPSYSSELLRPVTLQIVYRGSSCTSNVDEAMTSTLAGNATGTYTDVVDELILFSCSSAHGSASGGGGAMLHPAWHHLDEHLFETILMRNDDSNTKTQDDDVYRGLFCKLVVAAANADPDTVRVADSDNDDEDDDDIKNSNKVPSSKKITAAVDTSILLTDVLPLHPSKLRRLPQEQRWQHDSPDDGGVDEDRTAASMTRTLWGDEQNSPPPTQLPPNAVLVHYSDGSTRVHPQLYHLLVERNVVFETNPRDSSLIQDDQYEHQHRPRFGDDVFDTLNHDSGKDKEPSSSLTTTTTTDNATHMKKRSLLPCTSLLETDDESKAVPIQELGRNGGIVDIDKLPLLQRSNDLAEPELAVHVGGEYDHKAAGDDANTRSTTASADERESASFDLRRKKEKLKRLIEGEEVCLQLELAELHKNEAYLKKLMGQVRRVNEETKLIQSDTADIRQKQRELDFLLEAQRIKLLDELRMIYPIRCQAEETWLIRGQEIPSNLHSGAVAEDEISAGLGFLCHSVVMISKYLSVALRYRIVCNSSRSAVQLDAATILPLFQARAVERDELDRAMTLLDRNVTCILKTRGIRYARDAHILGKVNRVYESLVDPR